MVWLKRGAIPVFAAGTVACVLLATHWLIRSTPRYPTAAATEIIPAGSEDRPFAEPATYYNDSPAPTDGVRLAAATGLETFDQKHTADGLSRAEPPHRPLPLPPSTSGAPLSPSGPVVPVPIDPPASKPRTDDRLPCSVPNSSSTGRGALDIELPDSSRDERDAWHEIMKDLPANDRRELLRLRKQLGRLGRPLFGNRGLSTEPLLLSPAPGGGERREPPTPPVPEPEPPLLVRSVETERVIRESLAAIEEARHVVVHNIANAQTAGFKRRLILFEAAQGRPQAPFSTADVSGLIPLNSSADRGVRLGFPKVDWTPGKLSRTGRSLDLAIEGDGFLQFIEPRTGRTCYSRSGRLTTNAAGQIVLQTSRGEWPLEPMLQVPKETATLEVSADGLVRGFDSAGGSSNQLGSIPTSCFGSNEALIPVDGSLFVARNARAPNLGMPGNSGHGRIRQGYLEESNVDVKQELEELERLTGQVEALKQALRLVQSPEPAANSTPPGNRPLRADRSTPAERESVR